MRIAKVCGDGSWSSGHGATTVASPPCRGPLNSVSSEPAVSGGWPGKGNHGLHMAGADDRGARRLCRATSGRRVRHLLGRAACQPGRAHPPVAVEVDHRLLQRRGHAAASWWRGPHGPGSRSARTPCAAARSAGSPRRLAAPGPRPSPGPHRRRRPAAPHSRRPRPKRAGSSPRHSSLRIRLPPRRLGPAISRPSARAWAWPYHACLVASSGGGGFLCVRERSWWESCSRCSRWRERRARCGCGPATS